MNWFTVILIALVASAVIIARFRRGLRASETVEVVFDLRLPSQWAAQLTARAAENEGKSLHVLKDGSAWVCRVTRVMPFERDQIDKLCKRLHQIAASRGGGCAAHAVTAGSRVQTYTHRDRCGPWAPAA